MIKIENKEILKSIMGPDKNIRILLSCLSDMKRLPIDETWDICGIMKKYSKKDAYINSDKVVCFK